MKAGTITFREVLDADRRDVLHFAADSITLGRPLWEAVGLATDGTFTGSGWLAIAAPAPATRTRYAVAWRALLRPGVLGPSARVEDLKAVNWPALRRTLSDMGPTGWNHTRRAMSAFVTAQLGGGPKGKYHPFRLELMAAFPSEEEPEGRVPDLTVERFWEILEHVQPDLLKTSYVTMLAGGLGPGEYLRSEEHHLMPLTRSLKVIGTKKGRKGAIEVRFGERAWEYVRRAIPCPVDYYTLRKVWKDARKAVGQTDDRLDDLRHCAGQWATHEGVPEDRVGSHLRDTTPSTIRRYTNKRNKGEIAETLDVVIFGPKVVNG